MVNRYLFSLLQAIILLFLANAATAPAPGLASDQENCLMCHKYAGLGRFEKSADFKPRKRIFYVNDELFKSSYHGKLRCRNCHEGVDEIPHRNVKKVDCSKDCHLRDPSSGKKFSHKKIVEDLRKSAHGVEGSRSEHKEDLPTCKYCHSNKPYQATLTKGIASEAYLKVCLECHRTKEWVNRFFRHMIYRVSKRRSSKEIVSLCSSCHAKPDIMDRHELDVIIGFEDTFHGKAIRYGDEEVANCLNCHAPYNMGFSPHRIISRKNDLSPVNPARKIKLCRQQGCHPDAQEEFAAGGKVHPSGAKGMLLKAAARKGKIGEEEAIFQAKVINWINLFYKVLIAVVVGGLGLHRILDLFTVRREMKKGGH